MACHGSLWLAAASYKWLWLAKGWLWLAGHGSDWLRCAYCCQTQLGLATKAFRKTVGPDRGSKREASIGLALCSIKRVDKDMSMA